MVIQTELHSQNDSLNYREAGQPSSVSPVKVSKEVFLQHLLSFDKVIKSKAKSREGRTTGNIPRRQKWWDIKEVRRSDHRRYRQQPSQRRKNKLRSGCRTGHRISSSPRVRVLENISLSSGHHEAIHAPIPRVTVVSVCGDNDNCARRYSTNRGNILKNPAEITTIVDPYDIVELSEKTAGTALHTDSRPHSFESIYTETLSERRESVSSWRAQLLRAANTLDSIEADPLSSQYIKTKSNISVPNWSLKRRQSIRSPNPLTYPSSSSTSCYSNNNANAANSQILPRPCLTISDRSRTYPVIISNSFRVDSGDELAILEDSDCFTSQHRDFCPKSIFDVDFNRDNSITRQQEFQPPFLSSRKFESRHCWLDQIVHSSISNQARRGSPRSFQGDIWTRQNHPKNRLHSKDFNLNSHCEACDFNRSSLCYIPRRDMGCIQSIAKAKVSPDRFNYHCVIVEDIQAAIDRVPTQIEEKSEIVLRYKTPYFRASAQVIVPPIPKKETWTVGWIQACDSMKFINEYGDLGSSSWEIPALKERKITAVSDSDGVSYPWYGNTTEIASIEGPTDTSRSILLRMNDNFHPSVTWDIPVSEGSEAHLTHIVRDQSFTTWLAAVNQTTGRLEVLRTVKWHFFLEIDVDPTEELGKRAHIVSPSVQQQPIVLKNSNEPVYLSHTSSNRRESLPDRQHILEKRVRNSGDNNSNNHSSFIPKSALVRPSANNAQTLVWRPTRNAPVVVVPPKEVYRENNEVIWFSNVNGQGPNVKILSQRETTQLSKSMDS